MLPGGVIEGVTKKESLYCNWKSELATLPQERALTVSREKMETTPRYMRAS